ncbi:MAG: efflux RND transporter periplasmic adaptor subunit [Saprospirales bacterium]|nr:efflux RND transporter periplasmic adaptor subunit [Saprospirales bacterium]
MNCFFGYEPDTNSKVSGTIRQVQNIVTYYSPYSGYVLETPVVEGGYATEGSPVLRLADLRTLWVEAQLYVTTCRF